MSSSFHLNPPPGYRGLNPLDEIEIYTRHLPHWRQKGATYFVTFRLADSLPKEKLAELKRIKEEWKRELKVKKAQGAFTDADERTEWERLVRTTFEKSERWLDEGMGSCVLREPSMREQVADSLAFFDGGQYELGSFVVMPNHVHLLIRPLGNHALEGILRSRKRKPHAKSTP